MTDENTESQDDEGEDEEKRSQYGGGPQETDAVEQTEMREEEVDPPDADEDEESDEESDEE